VCVFIQPSEMLCDGSDGTPLWVCSMLSVYAFSSLICMSVPSMHVLYLRIVADNVGYLLVRFTLLATLHGCFLRGFVGNLFFVASLIVKLNVNLGKNVHGNNVH